MEAVDRIIKFYHNNYIGINIMDNTLIQIKQINDGHNFLRAIIDAYYTPYKCGYQIIQQQKVAFNCNEFIQNLRSDLALKLDTEVEHHHRKYFPETYFRTVDGQELQQTYYDVLSDDSRKYSLNELQQWLNSDLPLNHELQEYISLILEKDIYIIDIDTKLVIKTNKNLYKNRDSILLLFDKNNKNYSLLGLSDGNAIITNFNTNNPFILRLKQNTTNSNYQ